MQDTVEPCTAKCPHWFCALDALHSSAAVILHPVLHPLYVQHNHTNWCNSHCNCSQHVTVATQLGHTQTTLPDAHAHTTSPDADAHTTVPDVRCTYNIPDAHTTLSDAHTTLPDADAQARSARRQKSSGHKRHRHLLAHVALDIDCTM